MKKLLIIKFLAVALLFVAVSAGFPTKAALADTRCRIPLPLGGWTEGCPHIHVEESQSSCLSVFTDTKYEFRINNATGYTVNYYINDQYFSLANGQGRNHEFQKAYGSNSCNITHYDKPVIKFDRSYEDGNQWKRYAVGGNPQETFRRSGNGIDLYNQAPPAQSATRQVSLQRYFMPDPYKMNVTAQGTVLASRLRSSCSGYVPSTPTMTLRWSGQTPELRLFVAQSTVDSVLVVKDPSGNIICNDDWQNGDLKPMVRIRNAGSGTYSVWVGTYERDSGKSATLHITEYTSLNPANPE